MRNNDYSNDALINVAMLYYKANMSQQEIANTLNLSRPKVARMLAMCKSRKIVEININASLSHYERLAKKTEEQFGLEKVIVVESGKSPEESKSNVGAAAAAYLQETIRSGMKIGLAWGSTILGMIMCFTEVNDLKDVELIQLAGGVKSTSANLDGHEMVKAFALKMNAAWHHLQLPYIVDSPKTKRMLLEENEVKKHFEYFDNLDMAIVGVGSVLPTKTTMYQTGSITLEQSKSLVDLGASADICGNRLTLDGKDAHTFLDGRVITISTGQIRKTPRVVGMAAGIEKVHSLAAGLRGGLLTTIILDEVAAISLLNFDETSKIT